jgi:molybdenum cofactor biosynthesis enzyme MoaA
MSSRVDWDTVRSYCELLNPPANRAEEIVQHQGLRPSTFGPFKKGESLIEGWVLHEILVREEGVELAVEGAEGSVRFFLGDPSRTHEAGPFDVGALTISYLQTQCPYDAFSLAGDAIRDRIVSDAGLDGLDTSFKGWVAERGSEKRDLQPVDHPALFFDPSGWIAVDLDRADGLEEVLPQIQAHCPSRAILKGQRVLAYAGLEGLVSALKTQGFGQVIVQTDGTGWNSDFAQSLSGVHWELALPCVGPGKELHETLNDLLRVQAQVRVHTVLSDAADQELPSLIAALGALEQCSGLVLNVVLPTVSDSWNLLRPRLVEIVTKAWDQAGVLGIHLVTGGPGEIPPCLLGDAVQMNISLWHEEAMDLQGEELVFERVCGTCALRRWCPGLPAPGPEDATPLAAFNPDDVPRHPLAKSAEAAWEEGMKASLVGKPEVGIPLEELLPDELVPSWPCVLPWTRLELSTQKTFGPCCVDFQVSPAAMGNPNSIEAHWNSPTMTAFRKALTGRTEMNTCRDSCPHLAGGTQLPHRLMMRGGSPEFVENQIQLVHSLIRGDEELECAPMEVCITPTTYCNYDCLMCEWGEIGTLDDAYGPGFYEALKELLPNLHLIEAAGGEPLAAPAFRDFLAEVDFNRYPQLQISLTTNGSYLSPREQERMARVRFSNLTVSLNAASEETYLSVNRGLEFARVRANLDALLQRKRAGLFGGSLVYSMVLLKENMHEIEAFAELARKDDVMFRFMLPMHNRNNQSIMTEESLMRKALESLESVAQTERAEGRMQRARWVMGEARVLRDRLDSGLFVPLPDL